MTSTLTDRIDALRRPDGLMTMLANDQRESLRAIASAGRGGADVSDDDLRAFKTEVTRALSAPVTAVLLDLELGLTPATRAAIAPGCALILAADVLHQVPGGPVTDSSLDAAVTVEVLRESGAAAAKLLVIRPSKTDAASRRDLVAEFVALCTDADVIPLVEGIARPEPGTEWANPEAQHAAILETAAELAPLGTGIYKAEVPGYRPGDVSGVRAAAAELTRVARIPWVVLSNGVAAADFTAAAVESVAGGADGFLAGRAVWAAALGAPDPAQALATTALDGLTALVEAVAEARR
jgi:sulfofructosephosphate aldolase